MIGDAISHSFRIVVLVSLFFVTVARTSAAGKQVIPEKYRRAIEENIEKSQGLVEQGPYKPDWKSLKKHNEAPEWFRDAKFGIYFHWGVYSVPAFKSEWYPRHMHQKGGPVHKHHVKTYGDPSKFGYHDFVPMFKAEYFDAEEWAELFKKAGAKFAGPVCEHHDGYSMWDSELTPWNAADTGPHRDITGELEKAIRSGGMKFVTTFHHERAINWYPRVQGWPTTSDDPELRMMYMNIPQELFNKIFYSKLIEVIDKYQPDLIWFDGRLENVGDMYHRRFLSYYFNSAEKWGRDVVVTTKGHDYPPEVAVEDFEKKSVVKLTDYCWLTDDTISTGSWCYTKDLGIKPTPQVLHALIDIVSKNGQLLLNISPKSDGTIPENQREVLLGMGEWLELNGEAIYNTRPWLTFGEGPTRLKKGKRLTYRHRGRLKYGGKDIRYTSSKDGKNLYAIALGWPKSDRLTLKSVNVDETDGVAVKLLGYSKPLDYEIDSASRLVIKIPELDEEERPCRYA